MGAPVGSMVAGPKDFIVRVKKYRKLLGGAMRQAGIIAAPGFSYNCMQQRLAILFCRCEIQHCHDLRLGMILEPQQHT